MVVTYRGHRATDTSRVLKIPLVTRSARLESFYLFRLLLRLHSRAWACLSADVTLDPHVQQSWASIPRQATEASWGHNNLLTSSKVSLIPQEWKLNQTVLYSLHGWFHLLPHYQNNKVKLADAEMDIAFSKFVPCLWTRNDGQWSRCRWINMSLGYCLSTYYLYHLHLTL